LGAQSPQNCALKILGKTPVGKDWPLKKNGVKKGGPIWGAQKPPKVCETRISFSGEVLTKEPLFPKLILRVHLIRERKFNGHPKWTTIKRLHTKYLLKRRLKMGL